MIFVRSADFCRLLEELAEVEESSRVVIKELPLGIVVPVHAPDYHELVFQRLGQFIGMDIGAEHYLVRRTGPIQHLIKPGSRFCRPPAVNSSRDVGIHIGIDPRHPAGFLGPDTAEMREYDLQVRQLVHDRFNVDRTGPLGGDSFSLHGRDIEQPGVEEARH